MAPEILKPKILLIVPKWGKKRSYNYSFPLGLAYISASLKEAGYNVDCLNLNHIQGDSYSLVDRWLSNRMYDYILTGNTIMGYKETEAILKAVKSRKPLIRPKIILGGALLTSSPKEVFEDLKPDFGVLGEGEDTILELLDALEKKRGLGSVDGLIYFTDGKIIITKKRVTREDLDTLPFPDMDGLGFTEFLDNFSGNGKFFDYQREYPIIGSRSCPFQCTFCWHHSKFRQRSIENIMEELKERVRKYRINMVFVYDECFAINQERVIKFCREISKLREKLQWDLRWFVQLRVETVNKTLLKTLKDAGCVCVSYGFESYSPIVLKNMKKQITPEQIDNALKLTLGAGLAIQACFIFGDPSETMKTARQTLDYWKKNCQGQILLWFVQPYPDSEAFRYCIKKGLIKNRIDYFKKPGRVGNPNFNMTCLTDREMRQLEREICKALARHRRFVMPLPLKKAGRGCYEAEIKCPFCKSKREYRNLHIENTLSFSFDVYCKECRKRFYISSPLRKFANEHYDKVKMLRSLQLDAKSFLKEVMHRMNFLRAK